MVADTSYRLYELAWRKSESKALLFIVAALPTLWLVQALGWILMWTPLALFLTGVAWLGAIYEYRMLLKQRRSWGGILLLFAGFAAVLLGVWRTDHMIMFWWPVALFLAFVRLRPTNALLFGSAMLAIALWLMLARGDVPVTDFVRSAAVASGLLWIYWLFFTSARSSLDDLAQTRALLELSKEHMNQGLIVLGADRRVKLFNHRAAQMLSIPNEFLQGEPLVEEVEKYLKAHVQFAPLTASTHSLTYTDSSEAGLLARSDSGTSRYTVRIHDGKFLLVETETIPNGDIVRTFTDVTDFEMVNRQLQIVLDEYQGLRAREQQKTNESLLNALIKLSMYRDDETGQHILRTQLYIRLLAEALRAGGHYQDQLSDDRIELMVKAAPMHDLGKIGISDHILKKPGRHTPEESQLMRTHAQIGEATLMTVAQGSHDQNALLLVAARIAGGHHENWDGTGYPRGIVGQDIPLEARLMSLADVYDALTTDRIYKPAWTHDDAVQEILRLRGVKFDPAVVDVFQDNQQQFKAIAKQLADPPQEEA